MTKKVCTSRYGERNVWCPRYARCLDKCLADGSDGFSCRGCSLEHDLSGVPKDATDLKEDSRCCLALVISVFKRINAQEALNRALV